MKTKPARIRFNQEVTKPYCAMKTRRVPLHQEDAAKKIINDLLIQGIIKKQENNYADWCSPATFVPKKPAGLRLMMDFTRLNRFIDRPVHPFPTTEMIQQAIHPASRYFAKVDLVSAYHQIPLVVEDQALTTFLLPWGRFFYMRALKLPSSQWHRKLGKFRMHPIFHTLMVENVAGTKSRGY